MESWFDGQLIHKVSKSIIYCWNHPKDIVFLIISIMNCNSMKLKIHVTFIMISDFYLFVLEYEWKKEEYFLLIFQIYPMVTLTIGLSAHVGVPF